MFKYSVQSGLFCKHNSSCVLPGETKQRFVSLGECGPPPYIHIQLFSARLDIWRFPRTEWLLPPKHFSIPATPFCPICTEPDDVWLIRLEARILACLFSLQPKAWVWKVSPGKDGDAETLCDGKSDPYLVKQMQTLVFFFYPNLSRWQMTKLAAKKLAARFCTKKTVKKNCRTVFWPMNLQYYEMSYGLNVEMHKQVIRPHQIIPKWNKASRK